MATTTHVRERKTMPPLNLRWRVLGRPIKPVAFGLAIAMLSIFAANIDDLGILDGSQWGDFLGGLALAVGVMFFAGWLANSQQLNEWALLSSFWVFSVRLWLIIFILPTHGIGEELWLDLAFMIISGGAFLLEKLDSLGTTMVRGRRWTRQ